MIVSMTGALIAAIDREVDRLGRELGRDLHGQMIVSVTGH
jgi:hypothetical protein